MHQEAIELIVKRITNIRSNEVPAFVMFGEDEEDQADLRQIASIAVESLVADGWTKLGVTHGEE